ncbi:hypothetical protein ACG83_35750 [Frankia sp. R43]|nr:hypothetical protein ACG83_35750 [Frankia sp. R43]
MRDEAAAAVVTDPSSQGFSETIDPEQARRKTTLTARGAVPQPARLPTAWPAPGGSRPPGCPPHRR